MKPKSSLCSFLLAAGSSLLAISSASALDGTWLGNGNAWNNTAAWSGGTIADGTGFTANLTGVDIIGTVSMALGANRTIGNIIFTDATTSSHNLSLTGNTLNLDDSTGAPIINVTQSGRRLSISSTLTGNEGLTKNGLGDLTLSGTKSGLTGPITVNAGTLTISGAAFPSNAANTLNVASGATVIAEFNNAFGNPPSGAWTIAGAVNNNTNAIGITTPASIALNGGSLGGTSTQAFGTFLTSQATVITATGVSTLGGVSFGINAASLTLSPTNSGDTLNVTTILGATQATPNMASGNLIKSGAGTVTLNAQNIYTGGTRIDNGILTLGHATNTLVNTGAVNVNGGTLALGTNTDTVGAVTLTSGSITGSGAGTLTGTGSAYDVRSGSVSAKLGGTVGLTKSTSGTVTLTGVNTYSGATNINAGVLAVNGSGAINSSAVTINGGEFNYNSSTNYTGGLTFTSGTISGNNMNGSLSGRTIGAGQTIAPGNSPGTATTGSQTWATAGSYEWEINSTSGTAGGDPGWDLINGAGTLAITASAGNLFNINVTSLTLGNLAGSVADFNDALSYNWLIADFNLITGFAADAFNIDTSDFSNTFSGAFGISLGGVGVVPGDSSQIYLTYTAIPEPAAALLGSFGLLALLRRRRI